MSTPKKPISLQDSFANLSVNDLTALLSRFEWYAPLRIVKMAKTGHADSRLDVVAPWRDESILRAKAVDVAALLEVTSGEIIDRFLQEDDLRIVADGEASDEEVRMKPDWDDEDELVTEELGDIYRDQGLYKQAIAIYRKLSLLNPEKSVYFAELIGKIENNN